MTELSGLGEDFSFFRGVLTGLCREKMEQNQRVCSRYALKETSARTARL